MRSAIFEISLLQCQTRIAGTEEIIIPCILYCANSTISNSFRRALNVSRLTSLEGPISVALNCPTHSSSLSASVAFCNWADVV